MAEKISASDLKAQKDDFVIIDVREADELAGFVTLRRNKLKI